MDDLGQKLAQILQDPNRIQQIMEVASSMGFTPQPEMTELPELPSQEALEKVSQVLHQAEAKDRRQEALMKALLPYLKPNRQTRLERALQLSQLSRLAGVAFQSNQFSLTAQEDENHV